MRSGSTPPPLRRRAFLAGAACTLLAAVLVYVSLLGTVFAMLAIVVALGILALAIFGGDKVGFGLLCIGFALAALSKGHYAAPIGPSVTLSDLALFGGFVLLTPRLTRGRNDASAMYTIGMVLIFVTGCIASAANPAATTSLKTLIGMMWCMVMIPLAIAALRPSDRMVRILAWSFIVGHMISVLDALATTPLSARAQGLTAQSNEYAESGLIVVCLALYLVGRSTRRWPLLLATAFALLSIYTSGSRGALIAIAAVMVALPIVERTAVATSLFTAAAAVGAIFLPIASESAGQDSALSRLLGNGTASASDNLRNQGLSNGWAQFFDHPLLGSGLSNLGLIHSNLLEIAVGLGVFGFAGFCLVLISLIRPMFGSSEHRRLSYIAVAFVVFSATAPALTDRSMWVVLALGFAYFRGFGEEVGERPGSSSATAEEDELVVDADHLPQLG